MFPLQFDGLSGLGDPAAVIAAAIQKQEGYYPGSIAYKDNNPGNLTGCKQAGASGCDVRVIGTTQYKFTQFPDYSTGQQALLNQVQSYANQGLTIQDMMNKYAPAYDNNGNPTGNDPVKYAQNIAASLGVDPNTPLTAALASSPGDVIPLPGPLDGSSGSNDVPVEAGVLDGVDWGMVGLIGLGAVVFMYALD